MSSPLVNYHPIINHSLPISSNLISPIPLGWSKSISTGKSSTIHRIHLGQVRNELYLPLHITRLVPPILITNSISDKEAIRRLRKTNWGLETAVNSYFDANGKEALFVSKETCDVRQLHSIFEKYKGKHHRRNTRFSGLGSLMFPPDADQDIISIDGTMQFCQDLGLEPTQIEFLVLSHHLGSERMAEFTQAGFVEGWLKLRCDSIDKMKNAISTFRQWMDDDEAHFREIYLYAFKFGRQAGQKSLCKYGGQETGPTRGSYAREVGEEDNTCNIQH